MPSLNISVRSALQDTISGPIQIACQNENIEEIPDTLILCGVFCGDDKFNVSRMITSGFHIPYSGNKQ